MVIQSAAEAKVVTAIAGNGRHYPGKVARLDRTVESIDAVRGWTPFKVFFIVDVGSGKQFLIS